MKDYYKILGIERDATKETIDAAYRKLALQWHPDRNPDNPKEATEKFKEVAEAYEVLGNPDKRRNYDNPSTRSFSNFGQGGFRSPVDIFNAFFGGGFARRQGIDVEMPIELTFEEAALGCIKDVTITIKERCDECNGTGATSWKPCIVCAGTGRQIVRQDPFVMQTICGTCRGAGRLVDSGCVKCRQQGISGTKQEAVSVKIPAGAFSGLRMKATGHGEMDENGHKGDLYLVLNIQKHPFFTRQDSDIICEVPVAYSTMVLGGDIEVPTLRGAATVKIKPGTQDGRRMRLPGLGVANINNPSDIGDMYVVLKIDVPTVVNKEYEDTLNKLADMERQYVSPKIKEFNKSRNYGQ